MIKLVDSIRMGQIDKKAQKEYSIPETILMEDAALKAFYILKNRIWKGLPDEEVVFLAGKGNNGGDALVMARQCVLEGKRDNISIILASGTPRVGSAPDINLKICSAENIDIIRDNTRRIANKIKNARWIIDGLSGTGLKGSARSPLDNLIERINTSPGKVVSIDIPSGVGDAFRKDFPAVYADFTLTIGLPKICLYLPYARKQCGEIIVVPGIFPLKLVEDPAIQGALLQPDELKELLKPLPLDVYKNKRGHLAVFSGSSGTTGAAWLCSTAAARSRTGLVTLFIDRELYESNISKYNSVMVRPWDSSSPAEGFNAKDFTGLLIGPGWGLTEHKLKWLKYLISSDLPGVLDADGLTLLSGLLKQERVTMHGRWVLTPHPGEFARLTGKSVSSILTDPLPELLKFSSSHKAVTVLKGHCTFIASPEGDFWVLDGMNPALATGGSGDILSGIISGLIAGGYNTIEAARLGVLLHSVIGDKARCEKGFFLAEDLLPYISKEFMRG